MGKSKVHWASVGILPHFPSTCLHCSQLLRYYELTVFNFKWRPSAILDYKKLEILTAGPVWRANICSTKPNFVLIGRTVVETWPFFNFSRWRRPPCWFLKDGNFNYWTFQRANMHQRAKFRWLREPLRRYGRFPIFQNGGRPPFWLLKSSKF